MKFDIDDFQVKDAEPTGYLPPNEEIEMKLVEEVKDSDVFNGEIIYTVNDDEPEQPDKQTVIDLEETKVIPSKELEEILNSELFKAEENAGRGLEPVQEETEEQNEASVQDEADNQEEMEEIDEEELEELGDLNYHDEDVPISPAFSPKGGKAEEKPIAERRVKEPKKIPEKRRESERADVKKTAPVRTSSNQKQSGDKSASKGKNEALRSTHGKPVKRSSGNGNSGSGNGQPPKKENKIKEFFANLSPMDIGIGVVGVALLAVLIFVGNIFVVQKLAVTKVGSFASVGNQLENLTEIGNAGIKGVITQAADNVEILATGANDEVIPITVTFTSVEKDLKIKFENKYEETLIENVPFEIDATGPDKQDYHWIDEDKDGIIYQEKMMPGEYLVTIKSIDKYNFPDTATKVTVKDKITYTAINIINEIKTEDQIDASKEDTEKKGELETEPLLQDTVEWVESTKTIVSGADGYAPIDKAKIKDPQTLVASVLRFWKASAKGVKVGETITLSPESSLDTETYEYTFNWSVKNGSENISIEGDNQSETVTIKGNSAGDAQVICTITPKEKDTGKTLSTIEDAFDITVTEAASEVTEPVITELKLNKTSLTLRVKETDTLTATITPAEAKQEVTWRSSNEDVVKVDGGNVTALKTGDAVITCTSVAKDANGQQLSLECKVKVTDKLTLSLKEASATILVGEKYTIVPVVSGYKSSNRVRYATANDKIATVNENGEVTGVDVGSTEITVTTEEKDKNAEGKETALSVKFLITVKANPKKDTTTLLKDESGKQVYIKNAEGKYVEAKWADYYTAEEFYVQSEVVYKYTGWQTIKNKTYFFDANGKAVTGEQVIQGVKYNFASDGTLSMNGGVLGIDVSKWNGTIDWNAVKNSGISYVIIRCGYRGSATGVLVKDPKFDSYVSGANSAGLKVGIYFFSQAVTEVEAVEEASMAISLARSYKISYPVFIDTEKTTNGRANNISKETRTAICKAFCETVKSAGYTSGIYASKSWYNDQLNMSTLNAYKIWLAQYASQPSYSGRYDMWQYTNKGKVKGISGDVDMNISYLGY